MIIQFLRLPGLTGCLLALLTVAATPASDWPQLQHDAARTGRSADEVAPPYRARWLWFGNAGTLRNRLSKPKDSNWTNDLTTGVGKSYPLPASVPFTLAGMMQPIVHSGLVFVASQEGKVYAIREEDGATAWEADLPGGAIATGAATEGVVIFGSVRGGVHAYDIPTGKPVWTVQTGKAITGAPCVVEDRVYVANHSRYVLALHAATGRMLWKSERLGGVVQGSLAATPEAVYVGAEDMKIYKLSAAQGKIESAHQVYGQSFRLEWPVIHDQKLWVRTAPVWCVGSEGVNDTLLAGATSLADEEAKYLDWLNGSAVFGAWSSKNDWKNYFALNLSDLNEPFQIPCGPSEGCGQPPNPPAIDHQGNVVSWWPTRFCALTLRQAFGTRYFIDLAAVNPNTGRRKPFDAGQPGERVAHGNRQSLCLVHRRPILLLAATIPRHLRHGFGGAASLPDPGGGALARRRHVERAGHVCGHPRISPAAHAKSRHPGTRRCHRRQPPALPVRELRCDGH